jgi:hypothetical protein
MPVFFENDHWDDDLLSELDMCSVCGHATNLLIMFRAADLLISMCGNCAEAAVKAYEQMLHHRLLRTQREQRSSE